MRLFLDFKAHFSGGRHRGHPRSAGHVLECEKCLRPGLTLVELLVVVVIMAAVGSAAFTLFQSAVRNEAKQQNILEQTQNLRAALYTVSRDVRAAGNGMALAGSNMIQIYVPPAIIDSNTQQIPGGWFRYKGTTGFGVRRIFGTDSGTGTHGTSDTLTIFSSEIESTTPLGRLASVYSPTNSSNTLTLMKSVTEGVHFESGDILAVNNGSVTVILQAIMTSGNTSSIINIGPRFKPLVPMPDGFTFPEGSAVYNLRNVSFVTYYVDSATKRLMANYHDDTFGDPDSGVSTDHLVVVAENIEDFQVGYYMDSDWRNATGGQAPPMVHEVTEDDFEVKKDRVRAVHIAMVSRSTQRGNDVGVGESIEVMGHKANNDKGYTRRVMSEIVQLRN